MGDRPSNLFSLLLDAKYLGYKVDNVTNYDKVLLRMSFIGYQAPNVGHILWHAVTLIWHSFVTVQQPAR